MNPNLTEIIFIVDASGSMYPLIDDTIGGYSAFIEKQKSEPGDAKLTTVIFNDRWTLLRDRVDIKNAAPLNRTEYVPGGCTALMDAIGGTIDIVGQRLAATYEADRPSKVIVVIMTDGYENASKRYTRDTVKHMIEHQTSKYNWQFLFLGAGIDAVEEAGSIGIDTKYASKYSRSSIGTTDAFSVMSATVSTYRSTGSIPGTWASKLDNTSCNATQEGTV